MVAKGYVQLLRENHFFRRIYLARQISLLGDWFSLLAIIALLRSIGEESASAFGVALIVKYLPSLVATPWAGFFADRYDRRLVMIVSDWVRCGLALSFFLALIWPSVWLIYGIIILQSLSSTFFEPAKQALLPSVVAPENLATANALGAASWSVMLTVGSVLGGVCTEYFGWKIALLVDALTYLISIWFLLRVTSPPQSSVKGNLTVEISYALRYARQNLACWSLLIVKSSWNLMGAITLMLTLLGESVLGGVLGVSLLYSARGLGTGLGPIIARAVSNNQERRMEWLIGAGFLCGALFYIPIYWVSNMWLVALMICCAHIGGATIWVFSTVRLQQQVPEALLGRIFAFEYGSWTLMFVCSTAVYSWLADHYPQHPQFYLSCMGCTLLLPTIGWFVRMLVVKDEAS